jgi:hypothetical protein
LKKNEESEPNSLDREAKRSHLNYIERRWDMLAAIAWKEYRASGRGALLFTQTGEPGEEWDCIYLPLEAFEDAPLVKEYCDFVKQYDPTKQLVAIFLIPPDTVSAYSGGLSPERVAPPEAFRRFGHAFDWN